MRRPLSFTVGSFKPEAIELDYETVDWKPAEGRRLTEALYEEYALQSIRIAGSQGHPTPLVQSAAMASVAPPKPAYRPRLLNKAAERSLCIGASGVKEYAWATTSA